MLSPKQTNGPHGQHQHHKQGNYNFIAGRAEHSSVSDSTHLRITQFLWPDTKATANDDTPSPQICASRGLARQGGEIGAVILVTMSRNLGCRTFVSYTASGALSGINRTAIDGAAPG